MTRFNPERSLKYRITKIIFTSTQLLGMFPEISILMLPTWRLIIAYSQETKINKLNKRRPTF